MRAKELKKAIKTEETDRKTLLFSHSMLMSAFFSKGVSNFDTFIGYRHFDNCEIVPYKLSLIHI